VIARPTPAGWLLAALVVLLYAAGLLLGYPALVVFAVGGLALLVLGFVVTLGRPRVRLRRTVEPARVSVGEVAHGRIDVANPGRRPVPAFDAVDAIGPDAVAVHVPAVGAGATVTVRYPVPARRRGRIPLGPLTVRRTDPFGLFALDQRVPGEETVLWVHPRRHPVRPVPVGIVLDYEGRSTADARPGTVTFAALREYVAGDDPRHINWRATARTGTLIVRDHIDTTEPTTTVVLDNRSDALDPDAFEYAVEMAASVVRAVEEAGRPAALHIVTHDPGGPTALDRLALVGRVSGGDPVQMLDLVERLPAGGALVVITGNREPTVVGRLAVQRRRFSPVVVVAILGAPDPGDTGLRRRAGLAVVAARTGEEAAATWNRCFG